MILGEPKNETNTYLANIVLLSIRRESKYIWRAKNELNTDQADIAFL